MAVATSFTERLLDLDGCAVQILEGGLGPPLVFLHGGEGSARKLQSFLEPFARDFRVIAPLHPGFGASDLPARYDRVDDLVFHYLDVFDALGLEQIRLAGFSLGGWIAAALAVMQPRRFAKLALIDAIGIKVDGVVLPNPFMLPAEKALALLYADAAIRAQALPQSPDEVLIKLREREVAARFTFQRLYDPKLRARLHRIAVPTLVLWGERDALLPLDYGRAYAAAIPGARFATLDCGHVVPMERPAEFAAVVGGFFTEGL